MGLLNKQLDIPWPERDYTYIEYYQKYYEYEIGLKKESALNVLREAEARRDFHTGSLRQINNLIQMDQNPNADLKEPRWEIYKVSISFVYQGKIWII